MNTEILDQTGIMGSLLHYGMVIAFMGSALLVLLYLWSQKKLHWDEEPKFYMFLPDNLEDQNRCTAEQKER